MANPFRAEEKSQKARANIQKFVTLGLGNEKYAVEVLKVREILANYKIVPLPKTPEFIEGIISLRGDIIPVVDLRKRFELPVAARTDETRIIVIEMADFTVGIEVDRVFEVIKIDSDSIEPPPSLVAGLKADYLEGVCEIDGRLITILNLDEIFSSSERRILAEGVEATTKEAPAKGKAAAKGGKPTETERAAKKPAPGAAPQAAQKGPAQGAKKDAAPAGAPAAAEAVEKPAPRSFSKEVAVDGGGKASAEGKTYYVGKKHAGRTLKAVGGPEGVSFYDGDALVKRFGAV